MPAKGQKLNKETGKYQYPNANSNILSPPEFSIDKQGQNPYVSSPILINKTFKTNRRDPAILQDPNVGTELTPGQDYFLRYEPKWSLAQINEMFEKYSLTEAIRRKGRKMFKNGFRIVVPSEERDKETDEEKKKKHPKVVEIEKLNRRVFIKRKLSQVDYATYKTRGGVWLLGFNDVTEDSELKNPVPRDDPNLELLDIETYSAREITKIVRKRGVGEKVKYFFNFTLENKEGKQTKATESEFKQTGEIEVNADRVVENFYNPGGDHPNGIPRAIGFMNLLDRFRNIDWDLSDIIYRRSSPSPKGFYPKDMPTDLREAFRTNITGITTQDAIIFPMDKVPGDMGDLKYDTDFSKIADIEPVLNHNDKMLAAAFGMPRSYIFGEGQDSDDTLQFEGDLEGEQEIIYSPFLYRFYRKLEEYGIIENKADYIIDWNPLDVQSLESKAKTRFFDAQAATMYTNMGTDFQWDDFAMIDIGTLVKGEPPFRELPAKAKAPEGPRGMTDEPGSKPTGIQESENQVVHRILLPLPTIQPNGVDKMFEKKKGDD